MKNKTLTVLLIGVLVLSCLGLSMAKLVTCPDCKGSGEVDCPTCGGLGQLESTGTVDCVRCSGTGTCKLNLPKTGMVVEQHDGSTWISGTFNNKETIDVTTTVTAVFSNHKNSTEVTFPAGEKTTIMLQIPFLGSYDSMIKVNLNSQITAELEVTCPYCDGTGQTSNGGVCPDCEGTGTTECPTCEGIGKVDESALAQLSSGGVPWDIIGIVGAVVVVAGVFSASFLVFKRRRVNERTLRRMTSSQFNDWVLKRLDGKPATSRDLTVKIDGYTAGGQPVLIKQADDVGMAVIDGFAAALARTKTRNGVIVAYSYGGDAIRGKVRAQTNYKMQIEMLTVRELIESKRIL